MLTAWALATLAPVSLAALWGTGCGPTQTFGTVEGLRCVRFGDEVCSAEAGFPRAHCDFDGNWHILEHCGDTTCIVEPGSGGQMKTRCGNTPAPKKVDASELDTAGKTDSNGGNPSDSKEGPSDTGSGIKDSGNAGVTCEGYTCGAKQQCSFTSACEDLDCPAPCKAGERCSLGLCATYCSGNCFSTEYCAPSTQGDACEKMGCSAPTDLGAAYVAVELDVVITQPIVGEQACSHLKGFQLTLNDKLAKLSAGLDVGQLVEVGSDSIVLATLPEGNAAFLGRPTSPSPGQCVAMASCAVQLSKYDGLAVPASAGVCPARYVAGANGRFAKLVLPLFLGARVPMVMSDVAVDMPAEGTQAVLCGYVAGPALVAAQSAVPLLAGKLAAAVPDVDSNGDGIQDGYSLRVALKLKPAKLGQWLP